MRQFIAIVLLFTSAGCFSLGGSRHSESENPTLGRQLQDLKTARDKGAMTDVEYQQVKTRLLGDAR